MLVNRQPRPQAYRSRRPEVFFVMCLLACVAVASFRFLASSQAGRGKRERRVICTRHLRIPPKPGKSNLVPRAFPLKKWVGREKALASAGHVHSLNILEKLIYMQPFMQPAGFALTEVERSNNGK